MGALIVRFGLAWRGVRSIEMKFFFGETTSSSSNPCLMPRDSRGIQRRLPGLSWKKLGSTVQEHKSLLGYTRLP